jgi:hypothetical protein
MPSNTLSPYLPPYGSSPQPGLPELEGNDFHQRHELSGLARLGRPVSLQVRHELEAPTRPRSLAPSGRADAIDRTARSFRSLVELANAVIGDEEFQYENKHQLEKLIYDYYQSFPLSPKEAAEIRSRQTPEQYREIFDFMLALSSSTTDVTIHMDATDSGSGNERDQLYSSDFLIKPRTSPNEPVAGNLESRWVELSITVRSQHVRALARVLIDMVSRPESRRGPGMVRHALLVGASKQETSSFTGILHFSEAGAKHASAQEKIIHEMLLKEIGDAPRSGLYATCPPGWESPHPEHGIACFERSSTRFPELDSPRFISHILAGAINESCRLQRNASDAIDDHWRMNGYTGVRLASLPPHMLPHRRSHSAHSVLRTLPMASAVADALEEPGFRELLEITQKFADDPDIRSGKKDITPAVYQYCRNFPYSQEKALAIRGTQSPVALAEKVQALDALADRYATTVDIYMQDIGDGEHLRPGDALTKLAGKDGYETARDKVCNANVIIARTGAEAPLDQDSVRRVLAISVKEQYALLLAEVLTEIVSKNIIANTRIQGLKYIEFSKISSLARRAETAAIHFVEPDFKQMAELAEQIDQELMERMPHGAGARTGGGLYGEFPEFELEIRHGMIYREIPPRTTQNPVPSLVQAMSNAIVAHIWHRKDDLAAALYAQVRKKGHLPAYPSCASWPHDKAALARVREFIKQLPEDRVVAQDAPRGRQGEFGNRPGPSVNQIMPAELSADARIMPPEL